MLSRALGSWAQGLDFCSTTKKWESKVHGYKQFIPVFTLHRFYITQFTKPPYTCICVCIYIYIYVTYKSYIFVPVEWMSLHFSKMLKVRHCFLLLQRTLGKSLQMQRQVRFLSDFSNTSTFYKLGFTMQNSQQGPMVQMAEPLKIPKITCQCLLVSNVINCSDISFSVYPICQSEIFTPRPVPSKD